MNLQPSILKFDPYLNYNSTFLSPLQHGEVFVTKDGEEGDLDLGHYERFLGIKLDSNSCITTGKVFHTLLKKEREGAFGGETVQVIPHLVDEIIEKVTYFERHKKEILLIELGGTVSDLEQRPFLEAAIQLKKKKMEKMIFIHVAPILSLSYSGERKTKPTQSSLSFLKTMGIIPDILILRSEKEVDYKIKEKVRLNFPSLNQENILSVPYRRNIFEIPLHLYEQEKLGEKLNSLLSLDNFSKQESQELDE
ncbi:hypothetical protein PVNG_02480 [Plasmodium vivax North Korean]|uniref:CTP synthase N-terminal domain-containing protein n=1 Tax=Plasmodium vivax North Korean TaxID=1035514 RepID=A0A0J9TNP3_PLAVI|nr:hypothetical protein PVNG_02480 [Plasmodium vivax North Korean]